MSHDENNLFAVILRGETPASMVYEDEYAIAFMDLSPQVEGLRSWFRAAPVGIFSTSSRTTWLARFEPLGPSREP